MTLITNIYRVVGSSLFVPQEASSLAILTFEIPYFNSNYFS